VVGELQGVKSAASSKRQAKDDPASEEVKPNVAVVLLVSAGEADVMVVLGGVLDSIYAIELEQPESPPALPAVALIGVDELSGTEIVMPLPVNAEALAMAAGLPVQLRLA